MNLKSLTPVILSCFISSPSNAIPEEDRVWAGTGLEIIKTGGDTIGNVFSYSNGFRPYRIGTVSGPAAAAAAIGGVLETTTGIVVDSIMNKKCLSQASYDQDESRCETPPDFRKDMFCITNTDNINKAAIQIFYDANHPLPEPVNMTDSSSEMSFIELEHRQQVCLPKPKRIGVIGITQKNGHGFMHRILPIDFFSGKYGGLVKNGMFHLKQKREQTIENDGIGYKYCKDIMMQSNGFNTSNALKKCQDRLIEANGHMNPESIKRLFIRTMSKVDYQQVERIIKTPTLQEILKNVTYYKKSGSANKNAVYLSGTFMLDSSHYVYVEEKEVQLKDNKIVAPLSISLQLIKTTASNLNIGDMKTTRFDGIPVPRFSDRDGPLTLGDFIF